MSSCSDSVVNANGVTKVVNCDVGGRPVDQDSSKTDTTVESAGIVGKFSPLTDTFPCVDPCLVEDWTMVRVVHDYVVKDKQYLESSGLVTLFEPNKFLIKRVIVSGPTKMKDITDNFIIAMEQSNKVKLNCPVESITFDTGLINYYAACDVEIGTRKLIQISYLTDDNTIEQKKMRRVELDDSTYVKAYDPTTCDPAEQVLDKWVPVKKSATYIINEGRCQGIGAYNDTVENTNATVKSAL